jgi:hypothetical protein
MEAELPLVYFMTGWTEPIFAAAVELAKITGPLFVDGEDGPCLVLAEDEASDLTAQFEKKTAKVLNRLRKRFSDFV